MQTKHFFRFGLPALLLALGLVASASLSLTGCDTGGDTTPTPSGEDEGTTGFSLSGSFGTGGHISLQSGGASSSASVMRAITADSYPLEGVLEYNDVLVRLRGNYAPDTGNWSVSARYTKDDIDAIYTIDGNGGYEDIPFRKGGATVVMPDGETDNEWAPAFFPVETGAWSPNGEANDSVTEGGMPPEMHGYWNAAWDMPILAGGDIIHMTMQCLISDWKIMATGRRTYTYEDRVIKQNQNILSIEPVAGGAIDVISCYLEYQEDAENLAAALTEWLGLGEDGIKVWDGIEEKPESGPWIADVAFMPYPDIGGFNSEQWEEVQSFYAANGWEIWVASNAADWEKKHPNGPRTLYLKYRFQLDNDHLNMTKMVWGEEWYAGTNSFTSLEDLNTYATHLEHQWVLPVGGSEYEDEGVLTVPFTR
ncbi:MAG: hypothetical protein LBK73_10135 [Treponema sp.]|jgi:hypothetical protein|nr:hypothetical protein [Treponema sp.]